MCDKKIFSLMDFGKYKAFEHLSNEPWPKNIKGINSFAREIPIISTQIYVQGLEFEGKEVPDYMR